MVTESGNSLALRMDDPGASSKRYEVYSDWNRQFGPVRVSGNWFVLKYLPPFKKWGPYREIEAQEWLDIIDLLVVKNAKLTVGVTAAWAISEHKQIPFPERFPAQAEALVWGTRKGVIEIANHGFVHCVLEGGRFKPHLFTSNRKFHREFWDWVPLDVQERHIARAQEILQTWLGANVLTFIPPGNVFSNETLEIAFRYGLRYVSCEAPRRLAGEMKILGNENIIAFHDRDVVYGGVNWLKDVIEKSTNVAWQFVRDIGGNDDNAL